jgi:phosphatidate cytidylyltransferase
MAYVTVIRDDPALGLAAIVWLIVVVAAADIGAYFAGRLIGGPKLWPAVSPKKTWSGALGGLALGVVVGVALARSPAGPLARRRGSASASSSPRRRATSSNPR